MNKSKKKFGGLAVLLMLGGYALLTPYLQQQLGWRLPTLSGDSRLSNETVTSNTNSRIEQRKGLDGKPQKLVADSNPTSAAKFDQIDSTDRNGTNVEPSATTAEDKTQQVTQASLAESTGNSPETTGFAPKSQAETTASPTSTGGPRGPPNSVSNDNQQATSVSQTKGQKSTQTQHLRYGLLQEFAKDQFRSPAGLVYAPGSAEGHRLEHLRRHTKDQSTRPGNHGVFDGDMPGALKTIDLAYTRAKQGQRTTKKMDRNRTVYTVDMGKRVGFVGGRDGGRRRNPMAKRVRLVLEGNRVITAYPM
ncbi:MAG: hypothetical protein OSA98_04315 [Rubripirellula sp.]|nr:hypothetical protein [Rubripirellula sp.]